MLFQLSDGHKVIIDTDLYEYLSKYTWYSKKSRNVVYAVRNQLTKEVEPGKKRTTLWMHREILKHKGISQSSGQVTDHINKDGLDNRLENLRVTDASGNASNARQRASNSGYIGVSYDARIGRWKAVVNRLTIGRYPDAKTAAIYRDKHALKMIGEVVTLNFPELREWYLKGGEFPSHLV